MDTILPVLFFVLFIGLIGGIVYTIFSRGIRIVPDGSVAIVERNGEFNRVLAPGRHFLFPLLDRISKMVELKEFEETLQIDNVLTGDMTLIDLDISITFRLAHYRPRMIKRDEAEVRRPRRVILWNKILIAEDDVYKAAVSVDNWKERAKRDAVTTLQDYFNTINYREEIYRSEQERARDPSVPAPLPRISQALTSLVNEKTRGLSEDDRKKRGIRPEDPRFRGYGVELTSLTISNVRPDEKALQLWDAERQARAEAQIRLIKAASDSRIREIEAQNERLIRDTLGLTNVSDYLTWRYIEAIRQSGRVAPPPPGVNVGDMDGYNSGGYAVSRSQNTPAG
ncbi:SPFH domain-containing protein [Candidatus Chlorohelix sp.]|uniref:SPFH domain-containing protein n=1 Tax=Candidatus Chlorohelix sp. TaxID=3139201 RepID=UPI00304FA058